MSKIVFEELFVHTRPTGMIAVTTNSIVKSDGGLVMGRGSAGDLVGLVPNIRFTAVKAIHNFYPDMKLDGTQDYGFIPVYMPTETNTGIGLLQAKRNWMDKSSAVTVKFGLQKLGEFAAKHEFNIRTVIPGWGCGQIGRGDGIGRDELMALIKTLPDNVTFCVRMTDGGF